MDGSEAAIDAIRPLLPAWAGFASLLCFVPGAFLIGLLTCWVGTRLALAPLRRLGDAHWVERARVAWPAVRVAALTGLVPAMVLAVVSARFAGPLSRIPGPALASLVAVAAYLGAFAVRRRVGREISGRVSTWGGDLRSELTGWVLLAPQLPILVLMLALLAPDPGPADFLVLGLGSLGFGLASWFGGLPLARALGAARPAPPRLERIVAAAGARAGVRPRATWVVGWRVANALAYPLTQQLAFTERIAEELDDDELAAIAHHELGHLSEPWSVRIGRFLGSLALLPFGAAAPLVGTLGVQVALALLLAFWCLLLGIRRMARRMEERADAIGRRHQGDPGTYASALEKCYRANVTPVVSGQRRPTHPDLYERLRAAGIEPAYPRPEAPSRARSLAGSGLALACLVLATTALVALPMFAGLAFADRERGLVWSASLNGGSQSLLALGIFHAQRGESEAAIAFARAASAAGPRGHHAPAYLATLLGSAGRCGPAQEALGAAEARVTSAAQSARSGWLHQAREALARCRAGAPPAGGMP